MTRVTNFDVVEVLRSPYGGRVYPILMTFKITFTFSVVVFNKNIKRIKVKQKPGQAVRSRLNMLKNYNIDHISFIRKVNT